MKPDSPQSRRFLKHADRLAHAKHRAEAAEIELKSAVAAARDDGWTWAEIAAWLHMTRQGAHKRFARLGQLRLPATQQHG